MYNTLHVYTISETKREAYKTLWDILSTFNSFACIYSFGIFLKGGIKT